MNCLKFLKTATFATITVGFILNFSGCLEKNVYPDGHYEHQPEGPIGLFKIHLTLIDSETKDPLPHLLIKLFYNTSSQMSDPVAAEPVTDSTGIVHIAIAATPPVPQEFLFSLTDTTQNRIFQQAYISVRFSDPVFKYRPDDATKWGILYQGTADLTITRELKQIYHE